MQKIVPFLWFNNQAEEAVNFYTAIFKNGKIGAITRYKEGMPLPEGAVMTVDFQIAGQDFGALNGGPEFNFTPAVSFFVYCETREEIDTLWKNLLEGGEVLMELDEYPFSEQYGWVMDRYGVSWQLSLARVPQKIAYSLLFVDDLNGKAEEAVNFYVSKFSDAKINLIDRYTAEDGEREGNVRFASFQLEGQEFSAMDGGGGHNFTFTHAISFMVKCDGQKEVDYFWDNLSQGGETEPCGWLRDQFGVSWQVVPTILYDLLNDPDERRAKQVMNALLQMEKIDIAQLQEARELA